MKARVMRRSYWQCGGSSRNHTRRRIPGLLDAEAAKIRREVQGRARARTVHATSVEALLAGDPELAKLFAYGV